MKSVWVIARTTFREFLHEKIFFVMIFVALFVLGISLLLGELSFDEQEKILADLGFMSIEIAAVGISLFAGSAMLAKEIEKQTCLLVLSRPVSRSQFILGKVFGVVLLNTITVFVLAHLVLIMLGKYQYWSNAMAIGLGLWFESFVLLALVVLWSILVRPVLALGLGFVVFLLGHWLNDLKYFADKSKDELFMLAAKVIHWLTPNFYRFNWKNYFYLTDGVATAELGWMIMHCLAWIVMYILIAQFLFERKNIA